MNRIYQIYSILHHHHGPQGWWPLINDKTLLCEYHKNAPNNKVEQFEIIIGCILTQNTQWYPNVVRAIQQLKLGRQLTKNELEVLKEAENNRVEIFKNNKVITKHKILTQNTSWKNVEKALNNLRDADIISPEKILQSNKNRLAKLIRPSGYYNQKAERLKIVAGFFLENTHLENMPVSSLREKLLSVNGIGPETADSIILYAFRKPVFVIDTYTKRIFSRLGLCSKDIDYHSLQDLFHANLEKNTPIYNEYHALIVELAKRHCSKTPVCNFCPLMKICRKSL